jgi:hypothetical protein
MHFGFRACIALETNSWTLGSITDAKEDHKVQIVSIVDNLLSVVSSLQSIRKEKNDSEQAEGKK